MISGCPVKNLLLPGVDVMYGDAYAALETLSKAGVNVIFCGEKPRFDAQTGKGLAPNEAPVCSLHEILSTLDENDTNSFRGAADGGTVLRGKFTANDGRTLYMLANKSRTDAALPYCGKAEAEIWDPSDGTVKALLPGAEVTVPAMRALFILE